jgi:hypothetical protein
LEPRDLALNDGVTRQRATAFEDCLRRCEGCGIGLSNTSNTDSAVEIHRDPLDNLPQEVRDGALETLARSLNIINRKSKRYKFCSENSEDAVTWTIFSHLQRTGRLRAVFAALGVAPAIEAVDEPCLLLWGVPVPSDSAKGQDCANRLIQTIDEIQNTPQSRSEPDVILDFGAAGAVFLEVKFTSGNDLKNPSHRGWHAHIAGTTAFCDSAEVKATKCYELARNWRIAWQYAGERPFSLINLGRSSLFKGKRNDVLTLFASRLAQSRHRVFQRLTWLQLMQAIPEKPRWLLKYDSDRGLSVNRMDLVRPIIGIRSVTDCLQDLREVHGYLSDCGKRAIRLAAELVGDGAWGSETKRLRVHLTHEGRPYLVPRRLLHHNLIEVVNQCATLERLIDLLEWINRPTSGFDGFSVVKCHPTTSSDKGTDKTTQDHDLVLVGPRGETACFEISDVIGDKDGNRKEARDLISLGVLAGTKSVPQLAVTWPSGRIFMVGSREFADGVLTRNPNWKSKTHCHYVASRISESTTVIEVCRGPEVFEAVSQPDPLL